MKIAFLSWRSRKPGACSDVTASPTLRAPMQRPMCIAIRFAGFLSGHYNNNVQNKCNVCFWPMQFSRTSISQGSAATHLRCSGIYIAQCASQRISKTRIRSVERGICPTATTHQSCSISKTVSLPDRLYKRTQYATVATSCTLCYCYVTLSNDMTSSA